MWHENFPSQMIMSRCLDVSIPYFTSTPRLLWFNMEKYDLHCFFGTTTARSFEFARNSNDHLCDAREAENNKYMGLIHY